jgi:undecaprenyl-diphosphatase
LFFIIQRKFVFIIPLLITLAGTGLTILIGKIYFHRERPNVLAFYNEPSYSFPSGHATVSVAFYGLLFYFIIRNVKNIKHKFQLIAVSLLFILLLGFSRLYLCVHYLSDVAAGYSLGLLWLLLAISIIEWKIYNKQNT